MDGNIIQSAGTENQWIEILVEAASSLSDKPIMNNFHYYNTSTNTELLSAIEAAFESTVLAYLLPCLHTTYSIQRCRIRFVDDPTSSYTDFVPATTSGGQTGDAYSTAVAAFYGLSSTARGRSYRGSKHFGPLAENDVIGNELNNGMGAIPTRFVNLKDPLKTTLAGLTDSWRPVVLSRTLSPGLVTAGLGIVGTYITRVTLDKTVGTMRHRRERTVR